MTLIEIMVVILILVAVATGATYSLNAVTRAHLRSACFRVAAAARYSYSRATTRRTTTRITFDFAAHTLGIEEANGRVTLARADDARRLAASEEEGGDTAAVDPWQAAGSRIEQTFRPTLGASPFGPIADSEGEAIARFAPRPLARGVRIVRLVVPHEPEPRESGKGAIYFFPGGMSEHAVVQLSDSETNDTIYSIEIHALTGRARVYDYAFEPEPIRDENDESERSEVDDPS